MGWIAALASVVGAGISAASSSDSSRKALHAQQDAAKSSQIDIDQINNQIKEISRQNAIDSQNLEKQLNPGTAALRTSAIGDLSSATAGTPGSTAANSWLMAHLGQNVGSPVAPVQSTLLSAAIAQAQKQLAMGGTLPPDVQNLVTRHALATGASIAPGTLNLGRDLTTRDLGLTSLDLINQRIAQAGQLGQQEVNLGGLNANIASGNNNLALANRTGNTDIAQTLQTNANNDFIKKLQLAQFTQGIAQPQVGIDPGSAANIAIANANARSGAQTNLSNIYGQQGQNQSQLAGQLGGAGISALLAYNNRPVVSTSATNNPYQVTTTSGGYAPPSSSGFTTGLFGG